MSKFCHECGIKIEKAGTKFCPECGTPLNSLSAKRPVDVPAETFKPFVANPTDDDDSYLDRISHLDIKINALDVEIVAAQPVVSEKLGTFAATVPASNIDSRGVGPFSNLSVEQVREQFQKEAGSRVNNQKNHSINVDE